MIIYFNFGQKTFRKQKEEIINFMSGKLFKIAAELNVRN